MEIYVRSCRQSRETSPAPSRHISRWAPLETESVRSSRPHGWWSSWTGRRSSGLPRHITIEHRHRIAGITVYSRVEVSVPRSARVLLPPAEAAFRRPRRPRQDGGPGPPWTHSGDRRTPWRERRRQSAGRRSRQRDPVLGSFGWRPWCSADEPAAATSDRPPVRCRSRQTRWQVSYLGASLSRVAADTFRKYSGKYCFHGVAVPA
jgi:hypothetical protein